MPKNTPTLSIVERVADELAVALDSRETILVTCRLAYEGMENLEGSAATERRKNLSIATSRALAARMFPGDDARQEQARAIPNNRPGGASVSETAIKQRANAYAHVLSAGLTPDILTVTAAFRLHSITGKGHAEYVKSVTDGVVEGGDFVTLADAASEDLTAKRPGKGKDRAARPNDGTDGGEGLTPAAILAVLDWTIANVATFSEGDRAAVADRIANLSAALA